MIVQQRLQATIDAVALGINCTFPTATSATLQFGLEHTAQQRTAAQAALDAFDWSQAAQDAWEFAQRKQSSLDVFATSKDTLIVALRGVVEALVGELNRQKLWNASLKTAVANAATFAQLKTNIATLNNVNPLSKPQVRQAIANEINAGNAES